MSAHEWSCLARAVRRGVGVAAVSVAGFAIAAPDVGTLLRETDGHPMAPPRAAVDLVVDGVPFDSAPAGGAEVEIARIDFVGNEVFSDSELESASLEALGVALPRSLDFAALLAITKASASFYRAQGFPFASAVLPPQDLGGGRVLVRVLEGRYGAVVAQAPEGYGDAAQAFLQSLEPGSLIEGRSLERAALVVDGLPAVSLVPVVRPGRDVGTGDLEFRVRREAAQQVRLTVDNHGSRFSGANRLSVAADRFWLLAFGDQLSLRGTVSEEGTWFGALSYERPVGTNGLAARVSAARSDFTLGDQFDGFGGTSDTVDISLSYPLFRSAEANLALGLGGQRRWLENESPVGTEHREGVSAYLEALFDLRDGFAGGGVSYGSLRLARSDVSGADPASGTGGSNILARLELVRLQALPGGFTASLRGVGQMALDNTDAAADLAVGGLFAVRAFPQGEATGDIGYFAQAEFRRNVLFDGLTAGLFVDHGHVEINADALPGQGSNNRSLAAAGLALRFQGPQLSSELILAERLDGGEPRSDNRDPRPRVWLSLSYRF